jgi:hypothetical protein
MTLWDRKVSTFWRNHFLHELDVRGSVHHITIHNKSNVMQQCIKCFISPYLCEAQHVSSDIPPIIRSLKRHWQPLVMHSRYRGRLWDVWLLDAVQQPHVPQLSTISTMHNQRLPVPFEAPNDGRCVARKNVELHINMD